MTETPTWSTQHVAQQTMAIITEWQDRDGTLMPILHDVQQYFGYIPAACIPLISDGLNLSAAEIQGVISFYHDFKPAPCDKTIVKVCMAEACRVTGAEAIYQRIAALPGYMVEEVFCLGNCALSPAALTGTRLLGRLDQGDIESRLAGAQS